MGAKNRSLAGISSRNKKEVKEPVSRSVSKLERKTSAVDVKESASAVDLIKNMLAGKKDETKEEDYKDVETDESSLESSPLPNIDVVATSSDIKNAFKSLLNQFDLLYFTCMKNQNICSKDVERSCLTNCQHYGYCKVRSNSRESIKKI